MSEPEDENKIGIPDADFAAAIDAMTPEFDPPELLTDGKRFIPAHLSKFEISGCAGCAFDTGPLSVGCRSCCAHDRPDKKHIIWKEAT